MLNSRRETSQASRDRKPKALRSIGCMSLMFIALQAGGDQDQRQSQDQGQHTIPSLRTQSTVVLAPALVKDPAGKLIFGLEAKDFIIEDDGVEQQVRMDEAEPQEAVSLV
ncbi:MAG TPA: hypothetical protein VFT65_18840, partial [Candidatus Angelobacter sp.]|nr:hypothetical protein [Candidatus Angelobacter sp.]